ncbi:hypothetical protein F5J12DRAFT_786932 [Pisolithus orientalis]|uniref:uncharacterized protein n=1 Tax=Pisolithus orientalis TaxID=936130 RepID=UPI0022256D00|nr:uncharacterized protein F5J12DRAFT_786932 [Pisolithus orientalis]KAI5988241.1 hypothetical protein F5J12DRAFT_786932 [Pisolithus orientalis]
MSPASEDVFGMLEYLDTDLNPAMGTFINSFDCWIGAFMTDPNICQHLFEICMPLWMVWKPDHVLPDMQVLKTVEIMCPHDIVTDPEVFEAHLTRPGDWAQAICSSLARTTTHQQWCGLNSHKHRSHGFQCCKFQQYPPAGSRGAKPSVVLNPELWEDLGNPAIPPAMSAWHAALKDMNKDAKRVSPNVPKVAYFFPSLSLFVRDLTTIDQMMKSKILWDLYEHNFQFKLVTLDCAMMPSLWLNWDSEQFDHVQQIFPGDSELTMCAEPFPQQNQGLSLSNFQSKWEYIEKLQVLLAVWPGCPSDLAEPIMPLVSSSCVWAMEKKLAVFYFCAKMSLHQPKQLTRHGPSVQVTAPMNQIPDLLYAELWGFTFLLSTCSPYLAIVLSHNTPVIPLTHTSDTTLPQALLAC